MFIMSLVFKICTESFCLKIYLQSLHVLTISPSLFLMYWYNQIHLFSFNDQLHGFDMNTNSITLIIITIAPKFTKFRIFNSNIGIKFETFLNTKQILNKIIKISLSRFIKFIYDCILWLALNRI